jgi:hypothetical protein
VGVQVYPRRRAEGREGDSRAEDRWIDGCLCMQCSVLLGDTIVDGVFA